MTFTTTTTSGSLRQFTPNIRELEPSTVASQILWPPPWFCSPTPTVAPSIVDVNFV
ncbi:unnamed protein product [Arabidopsis lyrata]|nr:unnamed protein product [Arabidopsis lyrata]